jgi:preprotein translocase subunit Sec61beta
MSVDRLNVSGPQSSAGIMGVTATTNLGGWKFNPRGVVIFAAVFILAVKVLDILLTRKIF